MQKFYSNLIDIEGSLKEGYLCKCRGWRIYLEPNPSCGIICNNKPANEVVIHANTEKRAQYIANMVIAAHCLYTGEVLTTDVIRVFQNRAQTVAEIEQHILAGGDGEFGISNLSVSCLIVAKASQRLEYQYAIFKYLLSCHTIALSPRDLDPTGDWEGGNAVSILPEDHVFFANAIITAYSVLEELSIEIRAPRTHPAKIDDKWNPEVKEDLKQRLINTGINPLEVIPWNLRSTPTKIERVRKPTVVQKTEWASHDIRDGYMELFEAIAYASWLRGRVSAHRIRTLTRSLTIYDVANVQHLARLCLLKVLGFWRYLERNKLH